MRQDINQLKRVSKDKKQALNDFTIQFPIYYKMLKDNGILEKILKDIEDIDNKIEKLSNELETLMSSCDHEWEYIGHDSHRDLFRCKKCGKISKG